jgi:hypothetical protein
MPKLKPETEAKRKAERLENWMVSDLTSTTSNVMREELRKLTDEDRNILANLSMVFEWKGSETFDAHVRSLFAELMSRAREVEALERKEAKKPRLYLVD